MHISEEIRRDAELLWNYHKLSLPLPESVDLLLVLGSHDYRVAEWAARLVEHIAPTSIVVSGGHGKVTAGNHTTEAEAFRQILIDSHVPDHLIIVEDRASNTGENFQLSKLLLKQQGIHVQTGLAITKPYMERRVLATGQAQWPEVRWNVSSPDISFRKYAVSDVPEDRAIQLMVGDLQRIELYTEKGYQTPQHIPQIVWAAYKRLVAAGFDQFLIT